jgi:hypothetical protein
MRQTLYADHSDVVAMAEPESSNLMTDGLKYLGYLFLGLLGMFFAWAFKWLGEWVKKKLEAYVLRLEVAADRIDVAVGKISQLEANDVEIKKRLDEMQTEIHAIKTHLKL